MDKCAAAMFSVEVVVLAFMGANGQCYIPTSATEEPEPEVDNPGIDKQNRELFVEVGECFIADPGGRLEELFGEQND